MMWAATVFGSMAVQLFAGAEALRLIRATGRRFAWVLMTAGLWGMAARRGQSLLRYFATDGGIATGLGFEVLGLVISCCMMAGVRRIGPLFAASRAAREQAERHARDMAELAASRQQALARARVLRGLLPICAACKKIRDDGGYWHQVEAYLHAHTEADFSHGLCPECAQALYPEYCSGGSESSPPG